MAWRGTALTATLFWGCAILTFLSGVRRGVSFPTPGGATPAKIVTMLWLSGLGFTAMILTAMTMPLSAAILRVVGHGSLAVFDPIAARKLEAPLYSARLRAGPGGGSHSLPPLHDRAIGCAVKEVPVFDHQASLCFG